jgi:predicted ATPase
VLRTLPEAPERDQQELALQAGLGAPLIATRGYAAPEVERALGRARELCRGLGDTPQLFQVLWGLGRFYLVRPNLAAGLEVGRQLLAMAERAQSRDLLLEAHNSLGAIQFHHGDWAAAAAHLARGADLYDAAQHRNHAYVYGQDPGVVSLSRGAIAWWFLGYPDRSLDWSRRAIELSNEIEHPFSQAFALAFAANMHQVRGERELAFERAIAVIPLSVEHGFPLYTAMGAFFHGWALFDGGEIEIGIELMRQGLHGYRSTGAELTAPYFQALLAEAYSKSGHSAEGLRLLDEAQIHMESSDERWWEPELHRLRAELLLRHGLDVSEAEESLGKAIAVARRQRARTLELRSLARLCQLQRAHGYTGDLLPELGATYHWFTEGFATPDLVAARALLEESTRNA